MPGEDHYDLSAYPLFRSVINGRSARAKPKRCFVIAPSDDQDGKVRQHADTLWKYVIQPALLDTDYAARRAEELGANVTASQPSVDALLDDDLVIAVLSYRNARVFYETALAQAAARPLILMIEEGQDLAFDPRGAKVISYALDTDSVVSAVNVAKLQAVVREIEDSGVQISQGFRPGTSALNGGGNGGATAFERSRQFTYDQRLNMMREARTRIDIMGIANLAIAMHPDAAEVVRSRSGQDVEIRILQCAATNPALLSLVGGRNGQADTVKQEIEAAADAWRRIIDLPDIELSITVRRSQSSLPLMNALITDRAVVTTPYLRSRVTAESPTFHAHAGSTYHRAISQEFDTLWTEASTVFRAEPRLILRAVANGAAAAPEIIRPAAQPAPTTNARGFALIRGIGHTP
jgi:hypothetical protein